MSKIATEGFYFNPQRKVAVLNYSNQYISDVFTLLNTQELVDVVQLYLQQRHHLQNQNAFEDLDADEYLEILKSILLDQPHVFDKFTAAEILQSIEALYSFYRSFLRIAVINLHQSDVVANNFMDIDNHFNNLVIRLYRLIEEKLQGAPNKTYRQVNAGSSACILT
ncbi:phosphoenolpyruvate carboxykinase, partial [Lactobacillus sp. XV13L]|nr:phosphoenolpyruvate carboxykinase [Lactobacillus sp. XV13L]